MEDSQLEKAKISQSAQRGLLVVPPRAPWMSVLEWAWASFFVGHALVWGTVAEGIAWISRRPPGKWGHAAIAFFIRGMLRSNPWVGVSIEGLENLPKEPAVLCPNHRSFFDVMVLMMLPCSFRYVVRSTLFSVPLLAWAMKRAGYLALNQGDRVRAQHLLDECQAVLKVGASVLIFPEGTRQSHYELGTFNSGAARLAMRSECPIVPVAISGSEGVMVKGSLLFPRRGQVLIRIGPALDPKSYRTARRLSRDLRSSLQHEVDQLDTRLEGAL